MTTFTSGLRVAVVSGFSGHSHHEAFVDKVYKNGNFTLVGDETKQQWKPYGYCGASRAQRTGETSRYATTIQVWDEAFDKHLADEAMKKEHRHAAYELEQRIKSMRLEFLSGPDLLELKALVDRLTTVKQGE